MGNRYRRRDLVDAGEYQDRNSDDGPPTQTAIGLYQRNDSEEEDDDGEGEFQFGEDREDSDEMNDRQNSVIGAASTAISNRISAPVRDAAQNALDQSAGDYETDSETTVLTASREKILETAGKSLKQAQSRGFGKAGREAIREAVKDVISRNEEASDGDGQAILNDIEQLTAGDRGHSHYGQHPSVVGNSGGGGDGDGQDNIDASAQYEARYGPPNTDGSGEGGFIWGEDRQSPTEESDYIWGEDRQSTGENSQSGDSLPPSGSLSSGGGGGGIRGAIGNIVSYSASGGAQTTATNDIDTKSVYSGLTNDTAATINQTPFEGETVENAQNAKDIFRATAGRMSAQAKDPEVARDMFNHLGSGFQDNDASPSVSTSAGYSGEQASMNVPEDTGWQAASHEYGHLLADTYGYNDGKQASIASTTYADARKENPDSDPFIEVDPNNPEARLTQHNGEHVEDVPENVEQLMEAANTGWGRTQKAKQDPNRDADDYTVRTNYSATCAHEFLAQTSEYMQQDTPPKDDSFIQNQPDVAWSYSQVFEPSDAMKAHMSEMHHDDAVDDPFPEDPYPNI